jgi:hypothetical protein
MALQRRELSIQYLPAQLSNNPEARGPLLGRKKLNRKLLEVPTHATDTWGI